MYKIDKEISHKAVHIKSLQAIYKEHLERLQKLKKQVFYVIGIIGMSLVILGILLKSNGLLILINSFLLGYLLILLRSMYDLSRLNNKIKKRLKELQIQEKDKNF